MLTTRVEIYKPNLKCMYTSVAAEDVINNFSQAAKLSQKTVYVHALDR